MINASLVYVHLLILLWTTIFSFWVTPTIRGNRNFGLLASYLVGLVSPLVVGFVPAVTVWFIYAVIGGFLYYSSQGIRWMLQRGAEDVDAPNPKAFIHAILQWPLMIPEAIENTLAEIGVLKSK